MKKSTVNSFLLFLVVFAVILGYRAYQKRSARAEAHAVLLEVCAADAACRAVLDEHFDRCFSKSYRSTGRRAGGKRRRAVDEEKLARCLDRSTGSDFFVASD